MPVSFFAERLSKSNDDYFTLGAFLDGKLVGSAGFSRSTRLKETHKGLIWAVYVKAEARGHGIGRALLNEVLRRARTRPGLLQIALAVATHRAPARDLYLSLGFRVFGHEERALKVGNTFIDEDHMMLRLD